MSRRKMMPTAWKTLGGMALCLIFLTESALSQAHDPGPRPGPANAGGPIPGLTPDQLNLFKEGATRFAEVEKVTDGLGPRMNLSSCSGCHAYPAIGGSGPSVNPQYQFATSSDHGTNTVPSFITARGPTREGRLDRK